MSDKKTAVLVVSFGTSYTDTRKKTIEAIEQGISERYPEYPVCRAWTSGMIRRKVFNRDGLKVFSVKEAMEHLASEGFFNVIVQPTHVLNGIENDLMIEDVNAYADQFDKIIIGTPLLTSEEDIDAVVEAMGQAFAPSEDETVVFMGHGTEHYVNSIYAALNYHFADKGYKNIFMGTVEAYPDLDAVLRRVKESGVKKVVLSPFMIVAGDHANNDLAGDEEDSWKSVFEKEGFEVSCVLKGLGEYKDIQKLFIEHVEASVKQLS